MKKYKIVYADPPWHYGSKSAVNNSTGSSIKPLSEHYGTMSLHDLKALPVANITEEDAACFMWVTDSHLDEAVETFKAWGFKYKTIAFNWIKTTSKGNFCKNVAPWTMKSSEICLLGTKGAMTKYKKLDRGYQGQKMKVPDDDKIISAELVEVVAPNATSPIYVGGGGSRHPMPIYMFKGVIDDLRIYNRSLSEDEIQSLYHEAGWPVN